MEPKKKKNILIIDDEQAVRDLFIRTLQPGGFDIVAVADPDEGMEAAKQFEPDIVYISLLFPGSNGLKVSKSLHSMERLKEVPIVVLISYQGELDPKYTRTIGIVDVLVKPLKPADILAMTSRLLGEEISFESDGIVGVAAEETADEVTPSVGEADIPFYSGGVEGWSEEPEPSPGIEKRAVLEAADGIEDAGLRPDSQFQPSGREDERLPDLESEKEVREDSFIFNDVRPEEKDSETGDFSEEEGKSPRTDDEEDENHVEWSDLDARPETGKISFRKYLLFAGLVLLVAAAVFAALWAGILPGGDRNGKIVSRSVGDTPLKKETVREVAPPEKVIEENKTGEVQTPKQKSGVEGLAASQSPAGVKEASAGGTATKAVNEGLKEPKTFNGQRKNIYSVQVGVFGKESNAVSFAEELKKKGYDAFVEKDLSGGLHRVLVGRFADHGKAHGQAEALLKNDGIKSVIYRH